MVGKMINIEKLNNGNLRMTFTDEGKAEFQEAKDDEDKNIQSDDMMWDFLEYNLCNSDWERVLPEEIGALTDAPIISDEVTRDEDGKIITVGAVYVFTAYALRSPLEDMDENNGHSIWLGVGRNTEPD